MAHLSHESRARTAMALRILGALGLSTAVLSPLACGGGVVVEKGAGAANAGTGGAGGAGGTGGSVEPPAGCEDGADIRYECLPIPFNPAPCPAANAAESQLWNQIQGSDGCEGSGSCCTIEAVCGPDPEAAAAGECCYTIVVDSFGCEGRPFVVGGEVRLAGLAPRADWQDDMPLPETGALDAPTRAALAARYREAALFEHASVASFARFALELLGLGAPSDLVAAAQRAMGDEIRHARICFALASACAGEAVGPSSLPLGDAPCAPRPASELAAAVAFEGCLNETISALLAAAEAERATDPAVRAALASIAEDEAAHAELAWRSLAWLVATSGDAARRAAQRVLADPPRYAPRDAPADGADPAALDAHGWLSPAEKTAVADRAMRDVILPCARAMLDARPAPVGRYFPLGGSPKARLA